jgi:biotin carboxyl carrier protein
MKMEHTLAAPLDGTVGEVLVRVGQQVAVDELLVTVTA